MSRSVSIADVAAKAGVGVGTVSRVLNSSGSVSEPTRRKVLEVMDSLGYRPSRLASALSRGRTGSVAVLVPYLTRPSVVARLAGVISVFTEEGLDSVVCDIETPAQRDRHLDALTDRHRVDGIVALSLTIPKERVARLKALRIPLVMVDSDTPGLPRVIIDDVHGGRLATEHLLGLGHQRIGFIGDLRSGGLGFVSTDRRLTGYRQSLAATGRPFDPTLIQRGPHGVEPAAAMVVQMMQGRHPPTAVFAASDTQAIGVIRAAEKLGLSVPHDLSVIGFDDVEAAEMVGLTTIRQPLRQSGDTGARLMCDLMRAAPVATTRRVLPLEVVTRSTTSRLRGTDLPTRPPPRRPAAAPELGTN